MYHRYKDKFWAHICTHNVPTAYFFSSSFKTKSWVHYTYRVVTKWVQLNNKTKISCPYFELSNFINLCHGNASFHVLYRNYVIDSKLLFNYKYKLFYISNLCVSDSLQLKNKKLFFIFSQQRHYRVSRSMVSDHRLLQNE